MIKPTPKRCLALLFSISISGYTVAQTTLRDIEQTPDKSGGVYYAYSEPTAKPTPPPAGYEPFYVSHFGRHGSRYLLSDSDYQSVISVLATADSSRALSPLGQKTLTTLRSLWPMVEQRGGDLSPLGVSQQRGIALRMAGNYPQVFRPGRWVSARSTMSMRVAMSMAAFGDALKGQAPGLSISYEASDRVSAYTNWQSQEYRDFMSRSRNAADSGGRTFAQQMTRPDRLMQALFGDSAFVSRKVDAPRLMWGLYWIAVDMQDIPVSSRIYDIFTPDELYSLWQVGNYGFYMRSANSAQSHGVVMANARPLAENIIASADDALSHDSIAATLRFGHDGNIIPLLALLDVDNFSVSVSSPEEVAAVWSDYRAAPMAANLQIVFYRNAGGSVLVRLMLNEREVHLPVATARWPYYSWPDVRRYWLGRIASLPHTSEARPS